MAKIDLALRELHRSELRLARAMEAVGARHHNDHGVFHIATDLAEWSREHVELISRAVARYGIRLRERPRTEALTAPAQRWLSDRVGRRPQTGLLLIADLRRAHRLAAGVSLDWELVAQGAQAVKDSDLLAVAQCCHPQALRQMHWANAMFKELAPQALAG